MSANPAAKRRSAVIAAGLAASAIAGPAGAISEVYVSDSYSGIAIGGYDPVAYFVDGRPVAGKPEIEVTYDDAYWRFVNSGNAAAFTDAPTVYAPAYGGHGVLGVAGGLAQPGDPAIFAIHRNRLFFFFSPADRDRFLADPDGWVAAADARWTDVLAALAR